MSKITSYVLLISTFVIWGTLYVVSSFVLGKLPTFTVAFLRYFIGFIVLSLFSLGKREKIDKADAPYFLLIGIVGYFISVDAQLLGTKIAGSSMASLINSTNPIMISVMAALFLKERMTPGAVFGLLLSVAGVFVIIGVGSKVAIAGMILSFVSVLLWSFTSVNTRKIGAKYSSITITKFAMLMACVFNLPVAIGEIALTHPVITVDLPVVLSILYIGLICTALANFLWNKSLGVIPAHICASFYPIQTLTSSILGILFLHEAITLSFMIGSVLIIIGVLMSLMPQKQRVYA